MGNPIRVLHLEDDPRDAELVRETLKAKSISAEVKLVQTEAEFVAAIEEGKLDLILADYALPSFDGLSALRLAQARCPEIPFLFVSGVMGEDLAVEAMKAGAHDYVMKSNLKRLVPAIERELREAEARRQRRQIEAALRESEERFRQLAEHIDAVFWMSNADLTRIVYVSPAYERVWGRSRASLYAQPRSFLDAVHPEDRQRAIANLQAKQTGKGEGFVIEYRVVRPDGAVRWVRDRGFPVRDDAGQLLRMVGIAEDITERKRAEDALHASEERFRIAAETANDVIYEWDLKQSLQWSGKIDEILGYEPGEFPRTLDGWAALVHPGDRERTLAAVKAHLEGGAPYAAEYRLRRKDGAYRWWAARGAAARTPDGKPYRWIGSITDITERKQAEKDLRDKGKLLLNVIDSTPDYVFVKDTELRTILCNKAYANAVGRKPDELLGHTDIENGWDPELVEGNPAKGIRGFENDDRDALAGKAVHNPFDPANMGNEIRIFDTLKMPLLDEDNRIFGVLGIARDITERKRAEEALRVSGENFRKLVENAPDGIFVQTEGNFAYVNSQALRLFRASSADLLLGKSVLERIHPDFWDLVRERIRSVNEEREPMPSQEETYLRLDGTDFAVETTAVPFNYESKNGGLVFFRDITERKKAEAERERLMSAIEQAAEIIIITDAEGTIQYVNPAFVAVTGYSREEAVGQNPRLLKSGVQDEAFYRNLWKTLTGGATWKGHFVNKKKDGTHYTEEAMISPVRNAAGAVVSYVAVKRDITEDLRLRKEKEKLQEQFLQAQKMESIGRLAGGIAHDFNNILTGIGGYTELVLDRLDAASPLREDLAEVQQLAKRAADLTRQLLAFSRRQPLEPQILNLNHMLEDAGKMLKRVLGEDIDLHFAPAPDLGNVRADPGQIEQILMNLVVNSRDAMPAGGKLTIETANVELDAEYAGRHVAVTPGPFVMLAVSDTGCGMDVATKERIFEPFFTTKEKGRGTGLGLATVYGIVKQHGGNIWVYSEPGQGATFKIYLPTVAEAVSDVKPAVKTETERGHETILIVEDEAVVRAFTERCLKTHGYAVFTASNAEEAQQVFLKQPKQIALLLTDVVLPGMNGRKLYDLLKGKAPDLKVLYMSGYTDNAIVHQGMLDPGISFMQKPFTTSTLFRKVRQVLDS